MKWFTLGWWQYLLSPWKGWRVFFCRMGGHKAGPIWFTLTRNEPDMRCENCGEDLG